MPARSKTGTVPKSIGNANADGGDSKDEQYRLKRQRNNDAVKKTRAKSKETANERKRHIDALRKENSQLETQIDVVKNHVQWLKTLLLDSGKTEKEIQQILEEESSNEEDL